MKRSTVFVTLLICITICASIVALSTGQHAPGWIFDQTPELIFKGGAVMRTSDGANLEITKGSLRLNKILDLEGFSGIKRWGIAGTRDTVLNTAIADTSALVVVFPDSTWRVQTINSLHAVTGYQVIVKAGMFIVVADTAQPITAQYRWGLFQ